MDCHFLLQGIFLTQESNPGLPHCRQMLYQGKGERERYVHLNAELQRLARRDKKAFLIDQCKEIEENNRMGKTRDLFKKISDTKAIFHAKIGTIKDRNSMDLTEEMILRRGGKNTQKERK